MSFDDGSAQNYWENNPNVMYSQTNWISNPVIPTRLYSRISGTDSKGKHWLTWTLGDFLKKKFRKCISPGCGSGGHEIMMLKSGYVKEVDAFDFSKSSIELAREGAAKLSLNGLNAYIDNLNSFVLQENTYDLGLFAGSLHHVNNLENCLLQMQRAIVRDGTLVVWEYVGPCYLLWREKQIAIVNQLLDAIPLEFRSTPPRFLEKKPITSQLKGDPSEATRSAIIVDLLSEYFDFQYIKHCGGTILHPIYPLLNHERLMVNDNAAQAVLNLLMTTEEILVENNVISSDFVFIIASPRK
jgi:SAM-dependent methyltransferase